MRVHVNNSHKKKRYLIKGPFDIIIIHFVIKSFIMFYLFQYHKNAFHDELFLSVYFILKMELYFPGLAKHYSKNSALGCLEIVANKKRRVP